MVDFFAAAQRVISMIMTGTEIALGVWLASGGVIYLLRGISFWIDCTLVNCIGAIYDYFMTLLNGTMFNKTIVNAVMKNVYIFIGVFVFFRIAMLLIKYMINPEMIADQKVGTEALIKRVVIGVLGIIFIPTIFDYGMKLQTAIIEDQLVQQLFIPSDMLKEVGKSTANGGKAIGTTILSGFINPSSKASTKIKNEYKKALEQSDLSSIDFNSGGFLGIGYTSYDYSYFYLISTFILGYVLYLMLKYCLDIVVRFFKLFLFQLIAPIAMVEYMANGSDDGVFKNWKSAVLGSYFMLFIRIMSIWFVLFVMTLMNNAIPKYSDGSLLAENDYLLKALIMIGLLAFMMDLPKILGNILGLDLEQESSATGLLKSVGGILKGVGMGALAMGGAALGGAAGALGGFQKAGISNQKNRKAALQSSMQQNQGMNKKQALSNYKSSSAFHSNNAAALKQAGSRATKAGKGALMSMGGAALGATAVGNAIKGGYSNTSGYISKAEAKEEQQAQNKAEKTQATYRDAVQAQLTKNPEATASDIVDSLLNTEVRAKLSFDDIGDLTKGIQGVVNTSSNVPETLCQQVDQKFGQKLGVSSETTEQIVNQVLGGSVDATPAQVQQVVQQVINEAKNNSPSRQEMELVVNQVMGSTIDVASEANVTINEQQGQTAETSDTKTVTVNEQEGDTVDSPDDITRVVDDVNGRAIDDSPLTSSDSSSKSNSNTGYNKNNNDNDVDTLL